ncbi:unnamed protein product [Paramecium sonneborni]|uniref:Cation/H+ exchanger transmembrane domain-containing protein n=1 Tax=Paramecium sonneborni TaxID=65129 RepID=A0A8S1RGH8_9CILI|nr:unnamed protein product [Paramecium sonneborni]
MSGAESFGVVSITVIVVLFLYAISGAFFEHKHFHLIHETGLGIIMGALSGLIFHLLFKDTLNSLYNFNGTFFFYILLPIIIFCGGYNLNKRRFAQNFFYIMLFGLFGTIFTFIFILLFTYIVNKNKLIQVSFSDEIIDLKFENMMIFAATICASDSVAALTMIKPGKYPKLFSVVFGEGMVNDAVSIILFISVELISDQNAETWKMPFELILLFVEEFFGSMAIGIIFGLFTSFLFKRLRFLAESVVLEIMILLYTGYASFAICELLELSGVISVLVCGIILAHYNFYNLCNIGQISSKVTLNSLSLFCESFIYVYLGLALWGIKGDESKGIQTMKTSWIFILFEIAICFASRGLSLFMLTMLAQIFTGRKNFKLTFWELNIVWYAGIIRGSVAYALIQKLHYSNDEERDQVQLMQTTILIIVVVTSIILGALMPLYIVGNLQIQEHRNNRKKVSHGESIRVTFLGEIYGGMGEKVENNQKKKSKFYKWLIHIEENYMKPWFIYNYRERKEDIKEQKQLQKKANDENMPRRQTVQILRQDSQGNNPATRVSRVIHRSTLHTKYMGVQEVILAIDVPEEVQYFSNDEELKTQLQEQENIREVDENLESSNIK